MIISIFSANKRSSKGNRKEAKFRRKQTEILTVVIFMSAGWVIYFPSHFPYISNFL